MRKLMIAMLALAVVFGFAACDNSNSGSTSLMDKYVVALEVTGPEAYFAGDTVEKSDLTVTAVSNDGSKMELTEDDYSLVNSVPADATSATAKEEVVATVTYEGIYQGTIQKPTAAVKAIVYKVDAINVAVSADQKPYYTGSDIKGLKDDYTVTVYALEDPTTDEAADALYSMELESDDFVILSGSTELESFETTAKQYTLAFDAFPVEGALAAEKEITGGKANATLNVLTDYVAEFSVAEVALDSKVTTAKYAVVGGTLAQDTEVNYITVTYKMASDTESTTVTGADITSAGFTVAWDSSTSAADSVSITSGLTYGVKVTANAFGPTLKTDEAKSVNLTVRENEIKSFTVDLATPSTKLVPGTTVTYTSFKVTAKWLDNSATKPENTSDADLVKNLLIDGAVSYQIPATYPLNAKLDVEFSVKGYEGVPCNVAGTLVTGR